MIRARHLVALVAALLLAVAPPVAVAQSGAGDDQYQDPFAGSGGSGSGSSGSSSGSSGSSSSGSSGSTAPSQPSTPAPSSTPSGSATPTPASPSATTTSPQGATAGSTGAGQLPRTGFDVLPVAALGAVLLLGGLALARRAGHDRR